VVSLVAYFANLMLISSFLGLGAGAIVGNPIGRALCALPSTASESRFYASIPRLRSDSLARRSGGPTDDENFPCSIDKAAKPCPSGQHRTSPKTGSFRLS